MLKNLLIISLVVFGAGNLSACATGKVTPVGSIPGIRTAASIWVFEKKDGTAVITGQVDTWHDRGVVENYVRSELGYQEISNNLTVD